MRRRAILTAVFGLGAAATWGLMFVAVQSLRGLEHFYFSPWSVIAVELLRLGIPAAGGLWVLARVRRRLAPGEKPLTPPAGLLRTIPVRRALAAVLIGLYAVTWVAGVPAAMTALATEEVNEYKRLESRTHAAWWQDYPRLRTTVAFPVAPGIVILYHEAQLAGQNGWGGWAVYAWWGTGARRLTVFWRWLS